MGKFCGKCGAPIREGQPFCGKCGNPVGGRPAGGQKPKTQPKPVPVRTNLDRTDHRGKKKNGKLWLYAGLCLLLAIAMGGLSIWLLFSEGGQNIKAPDDAQGSNPAPDGVVIQVSSGQPSILLLIDETDFITGSESYANVTVHYGSSVQGNMDIRDAAGNTVGTVQNDGSGIGEARIRINTASDAVIDLTAVSGSVSSNAVTCYVHPQITQEMVRRLAEVAGDMADYIDAQNFAEPFGQEALQKVADHLRADSRVKSVRQLSDCVFYYTVDSLVGAYSMDESQEEGTICFGSAGANAANSGDYQTRRFAAGVAAGEYNDPDEAFAAFLWGADTSLRTLESQVSMTNNKIISLLPMIDGVVECEVENVRNRLSLLANSIGGQYQGYLEMDARRMLETGDYADCGFLYWLTHGHYRDNVFSLDLRMLNLEEFLESELDDTYIKLWGIDEYQQVKDSGVNGPTRVRLYFNYSGDKAHTLCGTTWYIADGLRDKLFDNTIFYMGCCYGHRDANLVQMFFDHGVKAFIGTDTPNQFSINRFNLNTLSTNLGKGENLALCEEQYQNVTLEQLRALDLPARFYSDENELLGEVADNAKPENRVHFDTANSERNLYADGSLKGKVVTPEGEPICGAAVKFYRWLNHQFIEQSDLQCETNEDGLYSAKQLKCGIYGIKAEVTLINGTVVYGTVTKEVTQSGDEAEKIVVDCCQVTGLVAAKGSNKPIPGAAITVSGAALPDASIVSDSKGEFRFCTYPDTLRFTSTCENFKPAATGEYTVPCAQIVILMEKDTITVRGVVQDKDTRAPIPGARFWLTPTETTDKTVIAEATTDGNGIFELECGRSRYLIHCSADGYVDAKRDTINVTGEEPNGLYVLPEPILLQKALVITAYSDELPGNNYFNPLTIRIPAVDLDTPEAAALNQQMYDDLYKYVLKRDYCVGYNWEVVGDVLNITTVVQCDFYNKTVKSYTLVLSGSGSDNGMTERQKMLAAVNLTEEQFFALARQRAAEIWDEKGFQKGMDVTIGQFGASSQSEWEKAREMTLSDSNLEAAQLSFHYGDLMVRMRFYYPEMSMMLDTDYAFLLKGN